MARSSCRQLSPALMMTGLSDHPGRVPYGLEDRTLSTLSHHFSPRPPALRFHGDGICGGVGDPGSSGAGFDASADRGRVGVSAGGAAVASKASSGAWISWWMASAISSSPTSEGLRRCVGTRGGPLLPGAGFSTKRVTRTWLPFGLPPPPSLSSWLPASAPSPLFVDLFPENHATLLHRPDESPLPDREWCADPACESPLSDMTARDTRTICSSPR
mmetsp:Transcript_4090/g.16749  ORF Transcript_4090/g.16749 Transcript_4090/m.16749 type:complete len:216 (-) Transcript_4090:950-1597(-)